MQRLGLNASTASIKPKMISSNQPQVIEDTDNLMYQQYITQPNDNADSNSEVSSKILSNEEVDWTSSSIYTAVAKGNYNFNSEHLAGIYYETEIPYILSMLKDKPAPNLFPPFLAKAKNTIRKLSEELLHPSIFEEIKQEYPNDSLEATIQYLENCMILMKVRKLFVSLFQKILERNV